MQQHFIKSFHNVCFIFLKHKSYFKFTVSVQISGRFRICQSGNNPRGGGANLLFWLFPPPIKKTAYNLTVIASSMDRPIQIQPVTDKRPEGISASTVIYSTHVWWRSFSFDILSACQRTVCFSLKRQVYSDGSYIDKI